MTVRLVVTVTCYLLSSLGLLWTLIMVTETIKSVKPGNLLIPIVFCYAWLAHLVMSVAWIQNKRLKKFWPISGTFAGISSLAFIPIFGIATGFSQMLGITAKDHLIIMMYTAAMVAPCVALAAYLVWFHMRRNLCATESNG